MNKKEKNLQLYLGHIREKGFLLFSFRTEKLKHYIIKKGCTGCTRLYSQIWGVGLGGWRRKAREGDSQQTEKKQGPWQLITSLRRSTEAAQPAPCLHNS